MTPKQTERAARELCRLRGWDADAVDVFNVPRWFAEMHEEIIPHMALPPEHRDPQVAAAIRTAMGEGSTP